jgi:hypothetical protein
MASPFVLDPQEYVRDINVHRHAVDQYATYLSIISGDDQQQCRAWVINSLQPGGVFEFKDQALEILRRGETGDRAQESMTVRDYIAEVVKEERIIAPTWTTYTPTHKEVSLLAEEIDVNIAIRNKAKKAMGVHEASGDKINYEFSKGEQEQRKRSNNATSGAQTIDSTPLANRTGHSTLTSVCRSTAGFGNANNERLLSGNRHYRSFRITLNNLVSIISASDLDQINRVVVKYGLVHPSHSQVMECLTRSIELYWQNDVAMDKLRAFVSRLSPAQRSAVVYTGDLYHIRKFNETAVREMLTELSRKVEGFKEDADGFVRRAPELQVHLAHQICTDECRGIGMDYSKLRDPKDIHTLACTIENIQNAQEKYADLIKTFITTKNLPPSVAYFPQSVRRSAIHSDTDSTIFTVQDWVIWYYGRLNLKNSFGVQAVMAFFSASSIVNVLAVMSINMGVDRKHLFRIAMKSEYRFDVFVMTMLGKHYYASIGFREGIVYDKNKKEIKGVHLNNSNNAAYLNDQADKMSSEIMSDLIEHGEISAIKYLRWAARTERHTIDELERGNMEFLRSASIKDPEAYTKEKDESPYQHHDFWNATFGKFYGTMPEPPYTTAKLSLRLEKSKDLTEWLTGMENRQLAEALGDWLVKKQRAKIGTFYIPLDILVNGMPKELKTVLDTKRVALDLCTATYLILETLGLFFVGEKRNRRLVSEQYAHLLQQPE